MRLFSFSAILLVSSSLALGCTTSSTVKDASTKHASNLVGLQQAVSEYRKKVDAYYDRLLAQQREAHIAMRLDKHITDVAESQAKSIATKMQGAPQSQEPATDFIKAGAIITEDFDFWRRNFDRWVEKTRGKDLAERRNALNEAAAAIEKEKPGDATAAAEAAAIRADAGRSDNELTFVSVVIDLKQQRDELDKQLDLLAAQVKTMQAFHDKVNDFLAIDATIDGSKIAAAAVAGSKADVAGLLGKK